MRSARWRRKTEENQELFHGGIVPNRISQSGPKRTKRELLNLHNGCAFKSAVFAIKTEVQFGIDYDTTEYITIYSRRNTKINRVLCMMTMHKRSVRRELFHK